MAHRTVVGLSLFLTSAVFSAGIDLTGTVKDIKGTAVAGAIVALSSNPAIKDTTDAAGSFSLSQTTAVQRGPSPTILCRTVRSFSIRDNVLYLSLHSPVDHASITFFSSNGTQRLRIPFSRLQATDTRLLLPKLTSGLYTVHLRLDRDQVVMPLFIASDGTAITGTDPAAIKRIAFLSVAATPPIDTLIVQKIGYVTGKKAITTHTQKGVAVVLELVSILPAITDYSSKGPFATKVETNVGPNNGYTVFRPDPLGQNGFLHAPIVFGPGIGQTVQPVHTTMLTNFASHGFVVVGTPVLNQGPGGAQNLKTMQDGLDWIVKQNTTAGSIYQGKLWADHCVSMGFSVGGTAAVQMGGAAAVFTVVSIHGHTAEAALHGPMFQTTGTLDNVGMPLQQATFDKSKVPTFLATLTGAAHQYIESNGGGEERKAIVAWMRYWIYNDMGAKNFFYGNDCVLCKSPWQNPQRKNWE